MVPVQIVEQHNSHDKGPTIKWAFTTNLKGIKIIMSNAQLTIQLLLVSGLFIAAIINDLINQKIPNKLCLLAIISGLLFNSYFNGLSGLLTAFYGLSLAFIILIPTFIFGILGAGDIKLMMGVGALIGPVLLAWSLAYGVAAGAITSILLVIWQTGFSGIAKTFKRYWDSFYCRHYFKPEADEAAGQRVPYAPALAIGWIWACSLNQEIYVVYLQWLNLAGLGGAQ